MSLSGCFTELIAYVAYFTESLKKEELSFEQVKDDIDKLIEKSETIRKESYFSSDDYDMARFAVFSYIDEKILTSSWINRLKWQKERLQIRYYRTCNAGFEFFERLNNLSYD